MTKTPKKLGVRQLTILTAVNMMGAGIILLPANLAQVGTISVLSWVVTTGGAVCLAFAFSRAATYSNRGAGMGGYAEYAHGKSGSFMTNYTYFVSLLIANVAIALTVVGYTANVAEVNLTPWATALATIGVLWLASLLNFGGPKRTGNIGAFTIWGVILPVAGISIIGWFYFSGAQYADAWNPTGKGFFSGVSASIAVTLYAFLGLESACANADQVDNPKKNVPIAVMAGTLIAAVLYIASTSVIAGIVPQDALAKSNAPFGLAFSTMFNPTIGKIIASMLIVSCFGSLFAWQFTIAEVARSSAGVGYFPRLFKKVSGAGAPIVGMVAITAAQSLLALMTISPSLNKQFTVLLNLAVMTNLIPYLLSMAALVVLQKVERVPTKAARTANIVAVVATVYSLYALYSTGEQAMLYGGLVTFAGWMLFAFVSPRFMVKGPPAIEMIEGEEPTILDLETSLAVAKAEQHVSA